MAFKVAFFCASALLVQAAFGQYVGSNSYVSGNSIVENDIFINSGSVLGLGGLNNVGLGLGNVGLSNVGLGNVGLGNVGLGNVGLGLGSVGLGNFGLGGLSVGTVGAPGISVAPGSSLVVTSISPIGPSGLAVASENAIQGNLLVSGQLPFLSAVAFEGALPTAGSGVATCGCGNGQVGITNVGLGGYPGYGYI